MQRNQIETITATIRENIQNSTLGPFHVLPTRRALAEQFNTTIETIGRVLHNLEVEGLIVKGKGRTMRVNTPRARITTNDEVFRDVMIRQGHQVKTEHIKTPGIMGMSPELAQLFRMPEGTPVIERMRREIVDGRVYRYSRKVYLAELVPAEHLEKMQADYAYNVRKVLEEARLLSRIEEIVIARVITEKWEADILQAAKGAPVLDQWKINYDEDKKVSWVSQVVFNAVYFEKRFDYAPADEPKPSNFLGAENY